MQFCIPSLHDRKFDLPLASFVGGRLEHPQWRRGGGAKLHLPPLLDTWTQPYITNFLCIRKDVFHMRSFFFQPMKTIGFFYIKIRR
jgi:hypothetical protein